jgi:hypothetical protein
MRREDEQHGKELGPKTPEGYADYFELAPQRPTFEDADHKTNSAGEQYPGHDRNWQDASANVSVQGDGNPGPVIPISGGESNEPKGRRHSIVDVYTGGRNYDPAQAGRVPDAGKEFKPSAPTGDPTLYANQGPQTPAFKRPIKLGWKERYKDALSPDVVVADKMTVGSGISQTPQRKKFRASED